MLEGEGVVVCTSYLVPLSSRTTRGLSGWGAWVCVLVDVFYYNYLRVERIKKHRKENETTKKGGTEKGRNLSPLSSLLVPTDRVGTMGGVNERSGHSGVIKYLTKRY